MRTFPRGRTSIRYTARASHRPADFRSLEMQSDAKASVAQPLTIDNPRLYPQISRRRTDQQRFIRVHLPLSNDAQTTRADVLGDRSFRSCGLPETGNLHRHSQRGSSFTSSRPRRHVVCALPCKILFLCTQVDDAKYFVNCAFSRLGILPTMRFLSDDLTAKSLPSPGAYPMVRFPTTQAVVAELPGYHPAL